jgi:iron-sulfur cluster repair protein YtfE (RIC family)
MAATTTTPVDFTMMYATHDAFRRDVARLRAAAAAGAGATPPVRAGWEMFKAQLLLHHRVEDDYLWPALRQAVEGRDDEGRGDDIALVADMVAEHALLDPLLAAIDEALADGSPEASASLAYLADALATTLGDHLTHEEERALPLIASDLPREGWRAFVGQMRRQQGVKGAAAYVPWVVDGWPADQRHRFLAVLPPPVRLVNRLVWERRHRRRNLWGGLTG